MQRIYSVRGLLKTTGKRALEAEMTHHLGYPPHDPSGRGSGNSRSGRNTKTLQSESGLFDLEVPRDRNSSFEPRIVAKRQPRVADLDEVIVHLYVQGQSTRAIQETLKRFYGADVSSRLVSEVTDSLLEEVQALAGSRSGEGLSDRLLRRAVRGVSRGGFGANAVALRGVGHRHAGGEAGTGLVDRSEGECRLVVEHLRRVEGTGHGGLFYCVCQQLEGSTRSDRDGLPLTKIIGIISPAGCLLCLHDRSKINANRNAFTLGVTDTRNKITSTILSSDDADAETGIDQKVQECNRVRTAQL